MRHVYGERPMRPLIPGDTLILPNGEERTILRRGRSVLTLTHGRWAHAGPAEGEFSDVITEERATGI